MDIKTLIKAAMDNSGAKSERELARLVGSSKNSVNHWLRGRNEPNARHYRKLIELAEKSHPWDKVPML